MTQNTTTQSTSAQNTTEQEEDMNSIEIANQYTSLRGASTKKVGGGSSNYMVAFCDHKTGESQGFLLTQTTLQKEDGKRSRTLVKSDRTINVTPVMVRNIFAAVFTEGPLEGQPFYLWDNRANCSYTIKSEGEKDKSVKGDAFKADFTKSSVEMQEECDALFEEYSAACIEQGLQPFSISSVKEMHLPHLPGSGLAGWLAGLNNTTALANPIVQPSKVAAKLAEAEEKARAAEAKTKALEAQSAEQELKMEALLSMLSPTKRKEFEKKMAALAS